MATQPSPTQQNVQREFVVKLSIEDALSLHEWFETAGKTHTDINGFASEVMQLPIIDRRFDNLTPCEEGPRLRRNVLTNVQKEEIFDLFDTGECGPTELALRYRVAKSTIRRAILEVEAGLGIVAKRRSPLNTHQVEEIFQLSGQGICAADVAQRFNVTKRCVQNILNAKKASR